MRCNVCFCAFERVRAASLFTTLHHSSRFRTASHNVTSLAIKKKKESASTILTSSQEKGCHGNNVTSMSDLCFAKVQLGVEINKHFVYAVVIHTCTPFTNDIAKLQNYILPYRTKQPWRSG